MESHTSAKSTNSSSSTQKSLIEFLKSKNVRLFEVSKAEIEKYKANSRVREKIPPEEQIAKFTNMLHKQQLPTDESFARVLAAFRRLDSAEEAIEIFNIINQKMHPIDKKRVIGEETNKELLWTYTSLLESYESQLKQGQKDDAIQAGLLAKAEEIWQICVKNTLVDAYSATSIMGIYKETGKFQEAIDIFDTYKDCADLDMYNRCMNILVTKLNNTYKALSLLEEMKQIFRNSRKEKRDYGNMRVAYNLLIISAFKYQNNVNKALQLFKEGAELGIYPANQMQEDNKAGLVKLNFHTSHDCRKEEGGLPLEVSKVAFLYFMQQVKEQDIHVPAKLITGGHSEGRTKLRDEFPRFLETEYQVQVEWNKNPRMLEFEIPYASLRKIRFIEDIWDYMDTRQDFFPNPEAAYREKKRGYRADLRRANGGRSDKHFSEMLTIPGDFQGEVKKLAEAGIDYYEQKKYKKAEQQFRKLIDLLPKHPWAYVQLGWVLHRTERFDEAIKEYNKAIELNTANNDEAKKLQSEIYRRIGWAYDRKHRQDKKEETLATAIQHYEQALKLNSGNYEVYNNWGIGLYRNKQYEQAVQQFERVRQNEPNHDEACVHLGDCYRKLGNFAQAKKYYEEAIERSNKSNEGNSAGWTYSKLGKLYYQQYEASHSEEDFTVSRNAFKQCLRLQPKRDQAYKGLAKLHEIKGDNDKASKYSKKAKDITPKHEDLFNKGKRDAETLASL